MKSSLCSILLFLFLATGFSQELQYAVRTTHTKQVKQEKIVSANTLSDVYQGYPASWISGYIATEITTTHNGNPVSASGSNEELSAGQKKLLQSVEPGADIRITVKYLSRNPVTDIQQENNLEYIVSLMLQSQAAFMGGTEKMNQYLFEQAIAKIPVDVKSSLKGAEIQFTVNEAGMVTNTAIAKSSGNTAIDALLLKALNQMPRWKPALDDKGKKVSQKFTFTVGMEGC